MRAFCTETGIGAPPELSVSNLDARLTEPGFDFRAISEGSDKPAVTSIL